MCKKWKGDWQASEYINMLKYWIYYFFCLLVFYNYPHFDHFNGYYSVDQCKCHAIYDVFSLLTCFPIKSVFLKAFFYFSISSVSGCIVIHCVVRISPTLKQIYHIFLTCQSCLCIFCMQLLFANPAVPYHEVLWALSFGISIVSILRFIS